MNIEYKPFQRSASIQGLRCLAFICIFLHHSGLTGMGSYGPFGVSIFIILSGTLMSANYLGNRKEAKFGAKFVWTKMKKLYPLHIITMLAMAVYVMYLEDVKLKSFVCGLLANIFMAQSYVGQFLPTQAFNGVSWYLAVCVITYLAFPILLKILRAYKKHNTAYVAIALSVMCILGISFLTKTFGNEKQQYYFTYNFPPFRIPEFFIGCNLGYLHVTDSKEKKKNYDFLFITGIVIALICCYIYDNGFLFLGQEYFRYTALFVLPACILIWTILRGGGICQIPQRTNICANRKSFRLCLPDSSSGYLLDECNCWLMG